MGHLIRLTTELSVSSAQANRLTQVRNNPPERTDELIHWRVHSFSDTGRSPQICLQRNRGKSLTRTGDWSGASKFKTFDPTFRATSFSESSQNRAACEMFLRKCKCTKMQAPVSAVQFQSSPPPSRWRQVGCLSPNSNHAKFSWGFLEKLAQQPERNC